MVMVIQKGPYVLDEKALQYTTASMKSLLGEEQSIYKLREMPRWD